MMAAIDLGIFVFGTYLYTFLLVDSLSFVVRGLGRLIRLGILVGSLLSLPLNTWVIAPGIWDWGLTLIIKFQVSDPFLN